MENKTLEKKLRIFEQAFSADTGGETGRKKIAEITRYLTIALSIIESLAMAIGFGNQGLFGDTSSKAQYFLVILTAVVTMTAGSALLMWFGERITENGVGNRTDC